MKISKRKAVAIGDSMNVDWELFDQEQFRRGLEHEHEHDDLTGGDDVATAMIVLAHLREIPDYYDWLDEMEKHAKASQGKRRA